MKKGYPRVPPKPVAERFWPKVEMGPDCWRWTGAQDGHGYGVIHIGTRNGVAKAYRVSWILAYGPIPKGMHVCHHCDNKICVRPDHLFLGTHADNMRDAKNKGRFPREIARVRQIERMRDPRIRAAALANLRVRQ